LNITSLNISTQYDIPANGLRAFSLKITTLTSLICANIRYVKSSDLFLIGECFPLLEELDLGNPRSDFLLDQRSSLQGIETLSLALRKVNLYERYFINDQVLHRFFKDRKYLKEVTISGGSNRVKITKDGIASFLRERPTLTSLSLYNTFFRHETIPTSHFIDSLVSLKGLTCIDWKLFRISNELLYSIAREGLPLTRLVLHKCTGYSYDGIFSLLSKCQFIQHLDLQEAEFLNDNHVAELSLFLGNLVSINLSECRLTNSALFALVRKCPSLDEIKMNFISIWKNNVENSNSLMDRVENHQLKSLHLACNPRLRDKDIKMFASMFSNLQLLDLTQCFFISEVSIRQVLSRNYKIRHLSLSHCERVKLNRLNFEFLKLEVLNLSYTRVDDEALCVISKNSCGLLKLFLQNCEHITGKGVKHAIKNCTQLKEINLRDCLKVPADVVASMVSSRPSLRKITSPSCSNFSDADKKHFSHHGCHVC
jgi:F-box/leucine-rich repeat protein 2/20